MKVIHAKGLEHHLQSGVTTRAPEPGAPIARGEPVHQRPSPTHMPGMPSSTVQVPKERHMLAEAIGEHMGGFHARMARLERFIMASTGIDSLAKLDWEMDRRDRDAAARDAGEKARGEHAAETAELNKPDAADAPSSEN